MAGTYAKADEALRDYAALLRDKVAAENLAVRGLAGRERAGCRGRGRRLSPTFPT